MTGGPGAEAWERVQALFHAALERPAGERGLFLRGACGSDTALLARVRAMLAADESGGDLLGGGLAAAAGRVLAGEAGLRRRARSGPIGWWACSAKAAWASSTRPRTRN